MIERPEAEIAAWKAGDAERNERAPRAFAPRRRAQPEREPRLDDLAIAHGDEPA